jgi:hypothetical protein
MPGTERTNMRSTAPQLADWLAGYGAEPFFKIFLDVAQDAESTCAQCGQRVYLDIAEGGGCPDWRTLEGDYGCADSPDTTDDGTGGHVPRKLHA